MKQIIKLTIIAGAAILLGSATSAEAQSLNCTPTHRHYSSYSNNYGPGYSYYQPTVSRSYRTNYGNSVYQYGPSYTSRYSNSRNYSTTRPRISVSYSSYSRSNRSGYGRGW